MNGEIDEWNRRAELANRKKDEFYQWLARQKFPLSRELVRKVSVFKLEELRDAKIKYVELIGDPGHRTCHASSSLRRQKIEIEFATPLPLADCDKKFCFCDYIARA